ncbi:Alpha/beta hydrolase fold-3 domain protein [Shewanella halifaxensis HAW-EB4]|uniref:Alpha/beta hydrolase fold-3 domain protein n=1 Tax=Shewanella halifaxensis (strain HAW-EB4) TaxID=458817 RepID=B0TMQ3_SHEHH|nr:alpha/beta hydrolase [Shewanella halifaxensis]ABZ77413.1 Alpha/beta hydrolase fold-3 domain protein [Shewanella halifaxensis HAW-EB4]
MKKTTLTLALFALTPFSILASGQNPLKVTEKSLPIPVHASQEVQNTLAVLPAPLNSGSVKAIAVPSTDGEWKAHISEFNHPTEVQGRQAAKDLNVKYGVENINGVEIYTLTPANISEKNANNLFLHIHGGAWIYGGNDALLREAVVIAHKLQMPVVSVNYRKAPVHPAPAALNDIITVWNSLLAERQADSIMMGGTSAGGNLTTAATLRMRDLGMPLPAALFIGTPAADVLKNPDSRFVNDGIDALLGTWDGLIEASVELYVGDLDPKSPYLSPVYGDFTGFPPSILVAGTRDLMLSDTILLHRAFRDAGSHADLHIYEAHSHGFYMLPGKDRTNFYAEMNNFSDAYIGRYNDITPTKVTVTFKLEDILLPESK